MLFRSAALRRAVLLLPQNQHRQFFVLAQQKQAVSKKAIILTSSGRAEARGIRLSFASNSGQNETEIFKKLSLTLFYFITCLLWSISIVLHLLLFLRVRAHHVYFLLLSLLMALFLVSSPLSLIYKPTTDWLVCAPCGEGELFACTTRPRCLANAKPM